MSTKKIVSYDIPEGLEKPLSSFDEKTIVGDILMDRPYRSNSFGLVLVLEGEIQMRVNLAEFALRAKGIYFIAPTSVYEVNKMSEDLKLIGVTATPDHLNEKGVIISSMEVLELLGGAIYPFFKLSDAEASGLKALMHFLHTKLNKPGLDKFEKDALSWTFLAICNEASSIYRQNVQVSDVKLTRGEDLTVQFLKLVGRHFKEQRSVQFYAESLFLTSRHLSQVIKEVTGKTAGELIDGAIILEAKILLAQPPHSVADISQELNFSNQSFFSKFFKSKTGISPSAYRMTFLSEKSHF